MVRHHHHHYHCDRHIVMAPASQLVTRTIRCHKHHTAYSSVESWDRRMILAKCPYDLRKKKKQIRCIMSVKWVVVDNK